MASSGWFSMSVHALALLAQSQEGYSSSFIASSVNTHAVFLRRVLKRLVEVGFIQTREGRDGGYRLAKPPEGILLSDVYKALEMDRALAPSPAEPNPMCPVGSGMPVVFDAIAVEAEQAILKTLQQYTVADVAKGAISAGTLSM
ncbi:RrF2 family transcriptional regulator [Alicyclobacillus fastidiosus]|uniref:Rrf2 family transcriptional regulator n=1 Tax=Alicyclobacillus fastidiosus TaxID=392011 RepID=A0ABV5ABV9_9BACL|nr:Rrf2 family transcriptional regulator [Alicyclobacillus fastidiosus]WEH10283.1 Rrf2 family transcriptional regulator [Alicyclobacillus fastidiosus]